MTRHAHESGAPAGVAVTSRRALLAVVSGGQTGVDQAALAAAQDAGLACGGWCPPGRVCEDGLIPARFPLRETPHERSPGAPGTPRSQRTEWNVRDSDATLVLRPVARPGGCADAGTDWARRCAEALGRPLLCCDPVDPAARVAILRWLDAHAVRTLHVAGPAEGTWPGVGAAAHALLASVFAALADPP